MFNMSRFFVLVLVGFLIAVPVIATENGQSLRTDLFTLYNAATGTVSHVATNTTLTSGGQGITTSTVKVFDYPMKYAACDVLQTPSTGGTVTWNLQYNVGSSSTLFNESNVLISGLSQTTAIATFSTNTQKVIPFRAVRAVFTGPAATTTVVKINCAVTQ